jgi:hypothetical protein
LHGAQHQSAGQDLTAVCRTHKKPRHFHLTRLQWRKSDATGYRFAAFGKKKPLSAWS